MNNTHVRSFKVTPSQYELFKFVIPRATTLRVRMIATAPVNLMLLDSEDRVDYERGRADTHSYTAAWGRRSDLEESVKLTPGTWYLVVEGSSEPSRGRMNSRWDRAIRRGPERLTAYHLARPGRMEFAPAAPQSTSAR